MKSRETVWSEEELNQLTEFVAAGGTPLRASVRFKRTMRVVEIRRAKWACRLRIQRSGEKNNDKMRALKNVKLRLSGPETSTFAAFAVRADVPGGCRPRSDPGPHI
jgi:hypothetical protein